MYFSSSWKERTGLLMVLRYFDNSALISSLPTITASEYLIASLETLIKSGFFYQLEVFTVDSVVS